MRIYVLAIACALAACHGVDAETKAKTKKPMTTPLQLTWSMKVDGKRLLIDYKVTNTGKVPVQIVEKLFWDNLPNADVIIVRNDTQPKTIAFTRALVTTNEKLMHTPMPLVRPLAAGASVEGHSISAWPPFAWHNFSKVDALVPGATQAVLEIGYVDHPDAKMEEYKLPTGDVVYTSTHIGSQKFLRGEPKPLPQ